MLGSEAVHVSGTKAISMEEINERGFYIVTAAVDRLDLLQYDSDGEGGVDGNGLFRGAVDVLLSGQVVYTGHSSMEVVVRMESVEDGKTLMLGMYPSERVCRVDVE